MDRTRAYLARLLRGSAGVVEALFGADESMAAQYGTPSLSTRFVGGLEDTAAGLEPASNSLLDHGGPAPLHHRIGRALEIGALGAVSGARAASRKGRDAGRRLVDRLSGVADTPDKDVTDESDAESPGPA